MLAISLVKAQRSDPLFRASQGFPCWEDSGKSLFAYISYFNRRFKE